MTLNGRTQGHTDLDTLDTHHLPYQYQLSCWDTGIKISGSTLSLELALKYSPQIVLNQPKLEPQFID